MDAKKVCEQWLPSTYTYSMNKLDRVLYRKYDAIHTLIPLTNQFTLRTHFPHYFQTNADYRGDLYRAIVLHEDKTVNTPSISSLPT